LQSGRVFGPIFVRSEYGAVPGTLPLTAIDAEGAPPSQPTPDLITSFDWDDAAVAGANAAVPGTEYASAQHYRGMHGSFSPRDIHNTLIARGPHFKAGFVDPLPTGNVDVPATIAALLGLHFEAPDGRVLREALTGQAGQVEGDHVEVALQSSDAVKLQKTCAADDPSCSRPAGPASYQVTLTKKVLSRAGTERQYTYFDRATATRR
jgi:hypothetical protein